MIIKHPEHHSRRIVEKFLWFPLTIKTYSQDSGETRWLEKAKIEQIYYANDGTNVFGWGSWRNNRFSN